VKILIQWLKTNSVMLINAGSLVGTTVVTSFLGFVYWWIAARHFPPDVVGIASASISAMALLGGFCILGLGTWMGLKTLHTGMQKNPTLKGLQR